MSNYRTINASGTRLRYTQIAPGLRYVTPVNKAGIKYGFGSRDDVALEKAIPGRIIGVSKIQRPPMYRNGIQGQHVAANPGSDYTQQYIKKIQISLASTFTDTQYLISGTVLWYLSSTNVTDLINIRIASINADPIPWQPGNGVEGLPFSQIFVTVPAAIAGATATLVYFSDAPDKPVRFF